jgi:hypothetical protein
VLVDDNVVKFQISMCKTHAVQVQDTTKDLQSTASNLVARHFASHDNRKEIERRVLHHFKPAALFMYYVDCFDYVAMMQSRADTELCSDTCGVLGTA